MEKNKTTISIISILVLSGVFLFSFFAAAGDLEPTAPPGPTMKTLDKVEPRIPISQTDIPLTINQSGSYYLTGNVSSTPTAITIDENDVTIDLMGYSITGPGSGTNNYGIYIKNQNNVEIRNGTVRGFCTGIFDSSSASSNYRIIDVRAVSNVLIGINLSGRGNLVRGCTANDNGLQGINVGAGSIITCCTASYNGTSSTGKEVYGIFASGIGCTISGNTAYYNGTSATGKVYGISAGGGTITGNAASSNGVGASNTVYGIYGSHLGCTVTGNTACNNGTSATSTVYGIFLGGNSLVDQNTAYGNNGTNMNISATCTYGVNHAP